MHTIRPCGCKGVRTCLQCETDFQIEKPSLCEQLQQLEAWSYCLECRKFFKGWDCEKINKEHGLHQTDKSFIEIPGIFVQDHFLSTEEANTLMQRLDAMPWTVSQSGRRKQNFGPRTNFNKRKLQLGSFKGFPAGTQFVQQKFSSVPLLSDFQTIEQCSLEYTANKGAACDPHIDDCWVWGERVVTVNCLGNAVLTLTAYTADTNSNKDKYNLSLVEKYKKDLILPLSDNLDPYKARVFRIPMPNCSLMVLYGPARYQFEHCVLREDILSNRRVCVAYREFTPLYWEQGEEATAGNEVTLKAKLFWPDENYVLTQ